MLLLCSAERGTTCEPDLILTSKRNQQKYLKQTKADFKVGKGF